MLKKLLKYEWKETWKIPALSILFFLAATLGCLLVFSRMEPPDTNTQIHVGAMILLFFYMLLYSILQAVLTLYFTVRFYKNLYSDEGYLSHTLPVTPGQHLQAKLLTALFWQFLTNIVFFPLLMAVTDAGLRVIVLEQVPAVSLILFRYPEQLFGIPGPLFLFLFLLTLFTECLSSVLIPYAAVSLGQLFSRHKIIAAILCYFGITAVFQTGILIAMLPSMTRLILDTSLADGAAGSLMSLPPSFAPFFRSTLAISLLCSLLISAVCYFLTEYLMKKQLNLD